MALIDEIMQRGPAFHDAPKLVASVMAVVTFAVWGALSMGYHLGPDHVVVAGVSGVVGATYKRSTPPAPRPEAIQAALVASAPLPGPSAPVASAVAVAEPPHLGEPLYDAASLTLRIPIVGALRPGRLPVGRLANGRIVVDVRGALPDFAWTPNMDTPDGAFVQGKVVAWRLRPGTRFGFAAATGALPRARVEGNWVLITAKSARQAALDVRLATR